MTSVEKQIERKVTEKFKSMTKAFRHYDSNHNGTLDQAEMGGLMKSFELDKLYNMGEKDIKKLFRRFDKDHDGEIGYAELAEGMKRIVDDAILRDNLKKQKAAQDKALGVVDGVDTFLLTGSHDAAGLLGHTAACLTSGLMNSLRNKDKQREKEKIEAESFHSIHGRGDPTDTRRPPTTPREPYNATARGMSMFAPRPPASVGGAGRRQSRRPPGAPLPKRGAHAALELIPPEAMATWGERTFLKPKVLGLLNVICPSHRARDRSRLEM